MNQLLSKICGWIAIAALTIPFQIAPTLTLAAGPDTEVPLIDTITGTVGTTGDQTLVTVVASDNVAPTLAEISIDGGSFTPMDGTNSPFTTSILVPSNSVTPISYIVRVSDAANNVTTSLSKTITVTDNDAPTMPSDPTVSINPVSHVATITAAGLDNIGIEQAFISINNGSFVSMAGTNPFTYNVAAPILPDTALTYTIKYIDAAGNEFESNDLTIAALDIESPEITEITGTKGTTGDQTLVTVTARDNVAPDHATISINGGPAMPMEKTNDPDDATVKHFSYTVVVPTNDTSSIQYEVRVFDAAGNQTSQSEEITVTDNDAPTVTLAETSENDLQDGALYKAAPTVSLTAEDNIDSNPTIVFMLNETSYPVASNGSVNLGILTDGTYTAKFYAIDSAGNQSAIQSKTFVVNTKLASIVRYKNISGTIDDSTHSGLIFENIQTTSPVLLSIGIYTADPGLGAISGVSAFGKYYEIHVSDPNKIVFPLTIKILYTQADLNAIGVSESQIAGIYYYNSTTKLYERYVDSGAVTTNMRVNTTDYEGYVWASVTHLTPIVAGADKTAPATPGNLKATTGNGSVALSWDNVSGANNYIVRVRPKGVIDYSYVKLGNVTQYTFNNLVNGREYEFGVAAEDMVGNRSAFGWILAKPKQIVVTQASYATPYTSSVESSTTVSDSTESNSQTTEPSDSNGKIKGDEATQNSRTLTTLAILLLALAAGIIGYYGYEWWLERRSKQEDEPKPKRPVAARTTQATKTPRKRGRPPGKRNSRNSRW